MVHYVIRLWLCSPLHVWQSPRKQQWHGYGPICQIYMCTYFSTVILLFHIVLIIINAIFWYETGPKQCMYYQHCAYWWPGASARSTRPSVGTVLNMHPCVCSCLTHWGWVTHICVSKLTIIGSDNGLSPARCQAIIWTNDRVLLIGPLGTNFGEILIEFHAFENVWKMTTILSASMC